MAVISKTSEEYKQLSLLKNPIKLSYIMTLFIITLLIIFSATWFGLYLAKGITVPIQDLAEATRKIAQGNLDHQIDIVADDEIGVLVDSFNQMTKDLKISSKRSSRPTSIWSSGRKYMETVLRNVRPASSPSTRTGYHDHQPGRGKNVRDQDGKGFEQALRGGPAARAYGYGSANCSGKSMKGDSGFIEKQVELNLPDRTLAVWMTTTIRGMTTGNDMGMVVVFEDLTQHAEGGAGGCLARGCPADGP